MSKDDIEFQESFERIGSSGAPEPIEPGRGRTPYEGEAVGWSIEPNRSGTIFTLGILSFCFFWICFFWPLGLVAWLMGRTDLAKIRAGKMSSEGKSMIRVGMALGLIGMLLPILTIVCAIVYAPKIPDLFPPLEDMFRRQPLPPNHLVYVGEWRGNKHTKIVIRRDGTADFKTKSKTVTGGKVKIEGETLSISIMGFGEEWRIDQPPKYEDGIWIMKLNGETFTRKAQESIVLLSHLPLLVVHSIQSKPIGWSFCLVRMSDGHHRECHDMLRHI